MPETPLVLFIDLEPNKQIDLRVAARSAIAWADLVESVGAHFDPSRPPQIDLVSSEPGSQKLKALIRYLGDDPKATIRTAIVSSIVFIGLTTAAWTWEQVLEWMKGPDAPEEVMSLSEEERVLLAKEVAEALGKKLAQEPAKRVYDELSKDTDVVGVGVSGTTDRRPVFVVSRNDFPPEIFIVEEGGFEKRSRVEQTQLVLFRPILTTETNKRWGFTWPFGKIGATIKDQGFLERLAKGELNIPMTQGLVFDVELEITEERLDSVWETKEYAILRVLTVHPPESQDNLTLE